MIAKNKIQFFFFDIFKLLKLIFQYRTCVDTKYYNIYIYTTIKFHSIIGAERLCLLFKFNLTRYSKIGSIISNSLMTVLKILQIL